MIRRRFKTSVPHQKLQLIQLNLSTLKQITQASFVRKLYLDPFMDMYNSEILSHSLSTQPNGKTVMEGLKEAISQTNDCPYRRTFHSDQGIYQMNVIYKH